MNQSVIDCTGDNANSTQCRDQIQTASDLAFAMSLGINLAVFVVVMVVFMLIRKKFSWCYEPMCDEAVSGPLAMRSPKHGWFGWFASLYGVSDREIALKRGLDALVYIKLSRYLFFACALYCVYTFLVLAPVHAASKPNNGLIGSASISMSNVSGLVLIADLVGVYFSSVISSVLMYVLYRSYFAMRTRHRITSLLPENFCVLVREIDPTLTEQDIRDTFERIFPGKVKSVRLGFKSVDLFKLIEDREDIGKRLEQAEAEFLKKKKRVSVRDYLNDQIKAEQSKELAAAGCAFVLFNDRTTAQCAAQCVVRFESFSHPLMKSWDTSAAPDPSSVLWHNLWVPHMLRWLLSMIVNFLTLILIFFWMIPVGFASSISNLTVLSQIFPFLIPAVNALGPGKAFIEGFLPSLAVIIFLAILVKFIITPLVLLQGHVDMSVCSREIFNKFYLFQVFNVFLGSVVTSGILTVLPQIVANPNNIINLLAKALPGQATYFTNLIMTMSMTKFALDLLRPAPLILGLIKAKFFAKSKRDLRATRGPWHFDFPVNYAQSLLVFLIASVFSTMSPLVLPFAMIYFFLSWMSSKYLLCYVCTPIHPAQGSMFPALFARICWSLITFQVVLFGVLAGRNFIGAVAVVPLIIAQVCFWLWTDKQLHAGSKYGSLDGDIAAVYSKEQAHMKKTVEKKQVEQSSSLLIDQDEERDEEEELRHLLPSADTYLFPTLRSPLFELEKQDEELLPSKGADLLFWPTLWERTSEPVLPSVRSWRHPVLRRKKQVDKTAVFVETL